MYCDCHDFIQHMQCSINLFIKLDKKKKQRSVQYILKCQIIHEYAKMGISW